MMPNTHSCLLGVMRAIFLRTRPEIIFYRCRSLKTSERTEATSGASSFSYFFLNLSQSSTFPPRREERATVYKWELEVERVQGCRCHFTQWCIARLAVPLERPNKWLRAARARCLPSERHALSQQRTQSAMHDIVMCRTFTVSVQPSRLEFRGKYWCTWTSIYKYTFATCWGWTGDEGTRTQLIWWPRWQNVPIYLKGEILK